VQELACFALLAEPSEPMLAYEARETLLADESKMCLITRSRTCCRKM
jgi:hypothetical protein